MLTHRRFEVGISTSELFALLVDFCLSTLLLFTVHWGWVPIIDCSASALSVLHRSG